MVIIDNKLSFIRDSGESLFTILIWNMTKDDLIIDLKGKLEKIKSISNSFKRKKLNDRIFNLIQSIENNNKNIYNNIILVSDDIKYFDLEKEDIKLLEEFNISKYTFEYGEYFNINWLKDLFENFTYYDIVINNNSQYTHYKGNLNKKKIINKTNNIEYIKNLNIPFVIVGKLAPNIKNKNILMHIPNNISWNEIIENVGQIENDKNINILQEEIDKILTSPDKYVYGNEIYEMIEIYNLKELYIHEDIKEIFNKNIVAKNLTDNLNFKIIDIKKSKTNNYSNIFAKDYSGILGIKYY